MRKIMTAGLLLTAAGAFAQGVPDTLSLQYCHETAVKNYPLQRQKRMQPEASALRVGNLGTNFLPQVSVNGQATWQSDVTEIPIKLPMVQIPEMNQDMYKITLDVNQTLYDGGNTRAQKTLENLSLQVDQQNLEVEIYKLKDRINQLYFNVLLIQENQKLLDLVTEDIRSKLKIIESGVKNGTLLAINADVLKAELLKTGQQSADLKATKEASLKMLEALMHVPLPGNPVLELPEVAGTAGDTVNQRQELKWFDLQQDRITALQEAVGVKTMPRVSLFGQAGYGRPGYNMLRNEFADFYMVGAKMTWSPWNWNQNRRDKQICDIQKDIVGVQKDVFNRNLAVTVEKERGDLVKYEEMIRNDKEIIGMRESIVKTYASQLENGVITSTEYVTEMNNLSQARLNLESHKVQLAKARLNILNLLGKQ